jgi:hypothetical protein
MLLPGDGYLQIFICLFVAPDLVPDQSSRPDPTTLHHLYRFTILFPEY